MQTIKEKIQHSGLKATPQRIAVYDAMKQLGHASADMVIEMLKDTFPTLTVATIYNVLESFVVSGLLARRYSSNNKMYFDVNTYEHAHVYDKETNTYSDYNDPQLIKIVMDYLTKKSDFNIAFSNIDIQLIK
ncbi:MAG: transcriptional repressor [Bacteroidales bacterium]